MTAKAVSNRMKSAGLKKLRWFCQMCEKQCRDDNGFKCHLASEGHLRMMKIFSENPGRFLSQFSQDFLKGFLDILSHRHGTKRVKANDVYQEYIADKYHVHMNATCWTTLSGFVQYLGKEGKVVADNTEKGWYIQYIERDPRIIAKQAQQAERLQADLDEEELQRRLIQNQIAAAEKRLETQSQSEPVENNIHTIAEFSNVKLNLNPAKKKLKTLESTFIFQDDSNKGKNIERNFEKDEKINDICPFETSWLRPGIVVRVKNKMIGKGQYYNKKGLVLNVIDKYVAEIKIDSDNDVNVIVRIDQAELETVIPKVGGDVMVLKGDFSGEVGTLLQINVEEYNATITLNKIFESNKKVVVLEYDYFSKIDIN